MHRVAMLIAITLGSVAFPALGRPTDPAAGVGEARSSSAVESITTIRLALEKIEDARKEVTARRETLIKRHEQLAADIKRRKSVRDENQILPDFRLQQLLRRSQALSETLTLLNRELEALKQARKDRLQQLLLAYDELIERTSREAQATGGQHSADLIRFLSRAQKERELARQQLMAGARRERMRSSTDQLASNDPEELSERADAVRDEQDRLRRELARLDRRIAQLRADKRIAEQMRDFIADQQIFDEDARTFFLPRTNAPFDKTTYGSGQDQQVEPDSGTDGNEGAYSDPEAFDGWTGDGLQPTGLHTDGSPPSLFDQTVEGRLAVGLTEGGKGANAPDSVGPLPAARRRRTEIIDRLKKLQILHDRLWEKIETLSQESPPSQQNL